MLWLFFLALFACRLFICWTFETQYPNIQISYKVSNPSKERAKFFSPYTPFGPGRSFRVEYEGVQVASHAPLHLPNFSVIFPYCFIIMEPEDELEVLLDLVYYDLSRVGMYTIEIFEPGRRNYPQDLSDDIPIEKEVTGKAEIIGHESISADERHRFSHLNWRFGTELDQLNHIPDLILPRLKFTFYVKNYEYTHVPNPFRDNLDIEFIFV